jgi:hypothetical protein
MLRSGRSTTSHRNSLNCKLRLPIAVALVLLEGIQGLGKSTHPFTFLFQRLPPVIHSASVRDSVRSFMV